MNDVVLLGGICLLLCMYVMYLHHRLRAARVAVKMMAITIAKILDGKVEVKKGQDGEICVSLKGVSNE